MIPKPVERVVLDTNVCLDLFVFKDPRWAPLLQALNDGSVEAVTRDDCRREWQIVLTYPHLPLDEHSRTASAAEFDRLIHCSLVAAEYVAPELRLPVCKDGDDQKFLEAACQSGAAVLITKDKALLKLARRSARMQLCLIQKPESWVAAHAAQTPSTAATI
jgi:putative PIN family toxin of toxin-antitoxin system